MPHLQLDTSGTYSVEVKREFARRLGDVYAEKMQTSPDIVDVTIREHGPGGVWRCGSEPHPSAVLSCDIRRGRTVEQRGQLADALVDFMMKLRSERSFAVALMEAGAGDGEKREELTWQTRPQP